MARIDLVRAQPPHVHSKKRRSRGPKRNTGATHPLATDFSDLEQAFFAAAPPDEPVAAPDPEVFEDVLAPPPYREAWLEALRWAGAAVRAALRRLFASVRRQRSARR